MQNHELLINKGFKLNEYPEAKYYELTIQNPTYQLLDIMGIGYDPEEMPEQAIFQTKEDFSNSIVMIEGEVWDLEEGELEEILEIMGANM